MMIKKISRRDFLKITSAVVGTAVAAEVITPLVAPERMEFDKNISLWASEQPSKNPPLKEAIEVDVAIIGGGYTGLSTAYHILQHYPEKSVAVLEACGIGHGASGRNGGMVLPLNSNEYFTVNYDENTYKRFYDMTRDNIDYLGEFEKTQNSDFELRGDGSLTVIARESQVEQLKKFAKQAQSLGRPVDYWDQVRTKNEIGTDIYFGSIFEPNAADCHPMKLVRTYKKAAENAGALIFEDSPVFEIEDGETIRLTVGEQSHQVIAKDIVLATNGYTSKLGYFKNSALAVHSSMGTSPILPESTFEEIGWKTKAGFFDSNTLLYHLGRTPDNRILIGGGIPNYYFNNGLINQDLDMLKELAQKELGRIYPKLAGMEFEYFWTGVLGFSLDFYESVGVMGRYQNIYYGLCYAGHGINLATLFGRVIADLYAGEASQWKEMPFLDHRFIPLPPEPLKWVAVQGLIQYYKMEYGVK